MKLTAFSYNILHFQLVKSNKGSINYTMYCTVNYGVNIHTHYSILHFTHKKKKKIERDH